MKLPESFLHFIWEKQLFVNQDLITTDGMPLQVVDTGTKNTNAGADFEAAQLRIGGQHWAGNIEIHVLPQEWYAHHHHTDPAYDNVILHVVWQEEAAVEIHRRDGSLIPTLTLRERVPKRVILQYESFLNAKERIPCQAYVGDTHATFFRMAFRDSVEQRLGRKAGEILELLARNQNDWEETFYQLLSKGFGFKVNAEGFLALARSLPLRIIQKHRNSLLQVEALLLGQAGFLEAEFTDTYPQRLQREYRFLAQKYNLTPLSPTQWKQSRVRPGNTPVVRLLQLGALLRKHQLLFSYVLETDKPRALRALFSGSPADYWQTHRKPDVSTESPFPKMGKASCEVILINALAPTLWAYGLRNQRPALMRAGLDLLCKLKAESNRITRFWTEELQLELQHAADSQGALELYNAYCTKKRCLNCAVGKELLLNAHTG